jgi:hypothetical protein
MKTLRILLATGALLLAFSSAFASTLLATYYIWVPSPSPGQCVPVNYPFQCSPVVSATPCAVAFEGEVYQLRQNDLVVNHCGVSLFKQPN